MAGLGDRTKYIGGSDVAVILGESKFKKRQDLLLEKLGLKKAFSGNEYTEFGHQIEDTLIQTLELEKGIEVCGQQDELHGDLFGFPFIGHIDGRVKDSDILVEVKSTGIAHKADWSNGLPIYYKGQVQTYLHFSKLLKAIVIVGFREKDDNGNFYVKEYAIVEEIYDAEYMKNAMPKIEDFVKDLKEGKIGEVMNGVSELELSLLMDLKADKKALDEQIKEIEDKVKKASKVGKNNICGRFAITLTKTESSRINTELLKADGLYDKYTKTSSSERLTIKEN